MYLEKDNIKDLLKYFDQCLNSEEGRKRLSGIIDAIQRELNSSTSQEVFDKNIYKLMNNLESDYFRTPESVVILILKNKEGLFDLYGFKKRVPVAAINLATSEAFLDYLRRNSVEGWVIDNVSAEDILIFLKTYYLYRLEPEISKDTNNLSREYSYLSLEMVSINNYFNENDLSNIVSLDDVLLYDKEALPYNLDYLDNYRKRNIIDVGTNQRNKSCTFDKVLQMVREDKYIGMSLKRYGR